MFEYFSKLFDTSDFPPRWQCGNWSSFDGWFHITSDLLIWLAYFAIPTSLWFIVSRRRDLPFRSICTLFVAFILLCGTTHLLDATMFWWPAYRLAGLVKFLTAIVSLITLYQLVLIAPRVLVMKTSTGLEIEIEERKLTENALLQENADLQAQYRLRSEDLAKTVEQLRITLASIGDAVIAADRRGIVTQINPVAEKLTGWTAEEAIGQELDDVYLTLRVSDEVQSQSGINPLEAPSRPLLSTENELILVTKDRQRILIEENVSVIRGADQRDVGRIITFHDISDRKQREREDSERLAAAEFLAALVSSADDAIVSKRLDGVFLSWNPAAELMFGFKADEVIGRRLPDFIPEDKQIEELQMLEQLRSGQRVEHVQTIRRHKDGSPIEVSITSSPLRDATGKVVGLSKILRDITKERQAERAAANERRLLNAVLDALPVGVVIAAPTGKIMRRNRANNELWGNPPESQSIEEYGNWIGYWPETGRRLEAREWAMARALQKGENVPGELIEIERFDGKGRRLMINTAAPVRDDAGKIVAGVVAQLDVTERIAVETALRQSRERLQLGAEVAGLGIVQIDYVKNLAVLDERAAKMFMLPADQSIPRSDLHERFHPDDRDRIIQLIKDATKEPFADSIAIEHRIVLPDGTLRWLSVRKVFQFKQNKTGFIAVSSLLVAVDITARKDAEQEIRAREEQFRTLAESIPQLAWMAQPDGYIYWYNQQWYSYTGTTHEQMKGWGWRIVHDPQELPRVMEGWSRSIATGEPFEMTFPLRGKDGEFRQFLTRSAPLRNDNGEIIRWFGTNTDITERMLQEQKLADSERRFRATINATVQHISLLSVDGRILDINQSALDDSGWTKDQAVGTPYWKLPFWVESEAEQREIEKAIEQAAQGEHVHFESQVQTLHEKDANYDCSLSPIRDEHGKVIMMVAEARDITERKTLEERLRLVAADLSEAHRRKDEFLATLAHELRNPLAPIRNGLQIMRRASHDKASVEKSQTMMERQINLMARLIDDLMDLSRINRGKINLQIQAIDLQAVLKEAIDTSTPLIDQHCQELSVSLPDQAVFVVGDHARLTQVFSNILNNAAKYTETHGKICLSLSQESDRAIVTISDNGVGIPEEMLPKIFDMFTQVDRTLERSQGGLGIGLHLVNQIVMMHHGEINVTSEGRGKGSTFTVKLPMASAPTVASRDLINHSPAIVVPKRILVVDDNEDNATSLAEMLQLIGHESRVAHDGQAAVLEAESFQPHVILMDIGMPKLNGFEACARIRGMDWGKTIVIVAQTGWGQDHDKQRGLEAGFDHHLTKPIDFPSLEVIINNA